MSCSQLVNPWIGRSIGERQRYRLERRLGIGGTADVFLAMDTLLGQPVALKLLHEKLAAGQMRKRFEREVTLCAALRSSHIVQVSDHGVTPEGYPFFIMEYLRGTTLGQRLRQEKRLSIQQTVSIVSQVCAGLHLAHQGITLWHSGGTSSEHIKVVHRDLKPDNIFLVPTTLGEMVKILDFGIAKICSEQIGQTNVTSMFLGTYRYAAPEQFEVGTDLDERADIYSLGIILYEMLSGTDPFGFGEAVYQLSGGTWAIAHSSKPVQPLRHQIGCAHFSPELEAVVMRCLQKSPSDRFSSVTELDGALKSAALGEDDRTLGAYPPNFADTTLPTDIGFSPTVSYPQAALHDDETNAATHSLIAELMTVAPKSAIWNRHGLSRRHSALLVPMMAIAAFTLAGLGIFFLSQSSIIATFNPSESSSTQEPISVQPSGQPETPIAPVSDTSVKSFIGHLDTIWAVAISPDGQTLVSGSFDKTINFWNLQTGELIRTLSDHTDAVRAIAISPDGQILVSGSGDKTIKIWNFQTGELLHTLSEHAGPVWTVALSPDGQTLASGSYDGTIKIWDVNTGTLIHTLPDHYDSVWSVAISPDGQTLVSGSYDGKIKVWNLQTGELLRTLTGHSDAVRSIAISPDGQTVASGSWDKTVKIWNLQTGQVRHTLTGHSDRVLSVAIDPTGKTLATGSLDRTINVWNLQTSERLHTLSGHIDWVVTIGFSPDGKTIASGSKDKTIRIWQP
ncbi:MAG: protein kinase [Cyanobacteria bacterium CRU_2_1]|nr:protein kinase [Cyanobacteria bacterium RU_5_0]NJR60779.1 protein kinase [Cyanobacteria bacterium CRU_2_1]